MKVKRIIEIEEKDFEQICEVVNETESSLGITPFAGSIIAQSTPYNPSGDCISREALKKKIREYTEPSSKLSDDFSIGMTECACEILDMIDNDTAVEPRIEYGKDGQPYKLSMTNGKEYERPKGEWIPMNPDCRGYSDYFKCSICGAYIYPRSPEKELDYNGCPYCFADMQEGGKE